MTDEETRGAPEGNDNAVKHGLYQKRDNLWENMSTDEQQLVVDISKDLINQFPDEDEIGAYERNAIRNIALDSVKRMRANEYIIVEDIIADGTEHSDKVNMVYDRLVRTSTKELRELGLLPENPESRKADAMEAGWMSQIEEATSAEDE